MVKVSGQLRSLTYISNARLPAEKANSYQTIKMCEAFASHGVEVELLHPLRIQPYQLKGTGDIYKYYSVAPTFTIRPLFCLDTIYFERIVSVKIHKLLKLSLVESSLYGLRAWLYCRKSWKDPEHVFYGRDEYAFGIFCSQRRLTKGKLIYEAHVFPEKRWRGQRIGVLKNLNGLVVITEQLKRLYAEAGVPEEKIFVAPDGVDLEQFSLGTAREEARKKLGLPVERHIIGYIGRFQTMGMEKGIPELIQALPHINRRNSYKPLLVCVGGPMEAVPGYEKLVDEVGSLSDQVMFVDRRPTMEVPLWIRACDVCTIPWGWNQFSAYYTSPLKLFEYMATGAAIVASDLPSLREVLRDGENAILVPPGDPVGLAHGLQRILDHPQLAARIAQKAYMDAQNYGWDIRAKKILSFIENLE